MRPLAKEQHGSSSKSSHPDQSKTTLLPVRPAKQLLDLTIHRSTFWPPRRTTILPPNYNPVSPRHPPTIILLAPLRTTTIAIGTISATTSRPTTIQLDPIPAPRNSISLTRAPRATARKTRRTRTITCATTARRQRRHIGRNIAIIIARRLVGLGYRGPRHAILEILERGAVVRLGDDVSGLSGFDGSRTLDLAWGEGATFGDVDGQAARVALAAARGDGVALRGAAAGDVERVEFALGGWLDDVLAGGVVCDVVAVHNVLRIG